jgi:hypothetical protein
MKYMAINIYLKKNVLFLHELKVLRRGRATDKRANGEPTASAILVVTRRKTSQAHSVAHVLPYKSK